MTESEALFDLLRRAREAEPGLPQIEDDQGHVVSIHRSAEHPQIEFSVDD